LIYTIDSLILSYNDTTYNISRYETVSQRTLVRQGARCAKILKNCNCIYKIQLQNGAWHVTVASRRRIECEKSPAATSFDGT